MPGKVVMFIDACHAGRGIERTRIVTRGGGAAADITGLVNELTSTENGIVMFASSTGRELSTERDDWQNGAFTKAVIEGLAGKADYNKDGSISVKELDLCVSERVKELSEKKQHPVARLPETIKDFPPALARWHFGLALPSRATAASLPPSETPIHTQENSHGPARHEAERA